MRSCELSVIKYILFVFNLIFAISGIGLVVAGAVILADVGEYSHFMDSRILAPPVVLIVAGCIVFLVASLGCFGAIKESYKLLIGFAICLAIIFIIELAVGIAACVYKSEFKDTLHTVMNDSLNSYERSKTDQMAWDHIQPGLECCGVNGPKDWPNSRRPMSCCHALPGREDKQSAPELFHCNAAQPGDEILYSSGCYEQLQTKVESAATVLIGVGIGIAFVEIIGIILACWLASAIKNRQ